MNNSPVNNIASEATLAGILTPSPSCSAARPSSILENVGTNDDMPNTGFTFHKPSNLQARIANSVRSRPGCISTNRVRELQVGKSGESLQEARRKIRGLERHNKKKVADLRRERASHHATLNEVAKLQKLLQEKRASTVPEDTHLPIIASNSNAADGPHRFPDRAVTEPRGENDEVEQNAASLQHQQPQLASIPGFVNAPQKPTKSSSTKAINIVAAQPVQQPEVAQKSKATKPLKTKAKFSSTPTDTPVIDGHGSTPSASSFRADTSSKASIETQSIKPDQNDAKKLQQQKSSPIDHTIKPAAVHEQKGKASATKATDTKYINSPSSPTLPSTTKPATSASTKPEQEHTIAQRTEAPPQASASSAPSTSPPVAASTATGSSAATTSSALPGPPTRDITPSQPAEPLTPLPNKTLANRSTLFNINRKPHLASQLGKLAAKPSSSGGGSAQVTRPGTESAESAVSVVNPEQTGVSIPVTDTIPILQRSAASPSSVVDPSKVGVTTAARDTLTQNKESALAPPADIPAPLVDVAPSSSQETEAPQQTQWKGKGREIPVGAQAVNPTANKERPLFLAVSAPTPTTSVEDLELENMMADHDAISGIFKSPQRTFQPAPVPALQYHVALTPRYAAVFGRLHGIDASAFPSSIHSKSPPLLQVPGTRTGLSREDVTAQLKAMEQQAHVVPQDAGTAGSSAPANTSPMSEEEIEAAMTQGMAMRDAEDEDQAAQNDPPRNSGISFTPQGQQTTPTVPQPAPVNAAHNNPPRNSGISFLPQGLLTTPTASSSVPQQTAQNNPPRNNGMSFTPQWQHPTPAAPPPPPPPPAQAPAQAADDMDLDEPEPEPVDPMDEREDNSSTPTTPQKPIHITLKLRSTPTYKVAKPTRQTHTCTVSRIHGRSKVQECIKPARPSRQSHTGGVSRSHRRSTPVRKVTRQSHTCTVSRSHARSKVQECIKLARRIFAGRLVLILWR